MYFIWWKLVDKKRLSELLLLGSFVAVSYTVIDNALTNTNLIGYPTRLFPFTVQPFRIDFTTIPILCMLAHQYSSNWSTYTLLALLIGVFDWLIMSPLLVALNIQENIRWSHLYFLPLDFSIGMFARFAYLLAINRQYKAENVTIPNRSIHPVIQPATKKFDKP